MMPFVLQAANQNENYYLDSSQRNTCDHLRQEKYLLPKAPKKQESC